MVYADGSNPSVRMDIVVRLPSPARSSFAVAPSQGQIPGVGLSGNRVRDPDLIPRAGLAGNHDSAPINAAKVAAASDCMPGITWA
jgi:hypothetical protein